MTPLHRSLSANLVTARPSANAPGRSKSSENAMRRASSSPDITQLSCPETRNNFGISIGPAVGQLYTSQPQSLTGQMKMKQELKSLAQQQANQDIQFKKLMERARFRCGKHNTLLKDIKRLCTFVRTNPKARGRAVVKEHILKRLLPAIEKSRRRLTDLTTQVNSGIYALIGEVYTDEMRAKDEDIDSFAICSETWSAAEALIQGHNLKYHYMRASIARKYEQCSKDKGCAQRAFIKQCIRDTKYRREQDLEMLAYFREELDILVSSQQLPAQPDISSDQRSVTKGRAGKTTVDGTVSEDGAALNQIRRDLDDFIELVRLKINMEMNFTVDHKMRGQPRDIPGLYILAESSLAELTSWLDTRYFLDKRWTIREYEKALYHGCAAAECS